MKTNYQRKERKSNHAFEVVRGQELLWTQNVDSITAPIRSWP